MTLTKLQQDADGEWVLYEDDSPYGVEVYFGVSEQPPDQASLDVAEAVSQAITGLAAKASTLLASSFAGSKLATTPADLNLLWVEVPATKTPDTGRFGLAFYPDWDPYVLLIVWFDTAPDDLADAEPHFWSHRYR